MKQAYVLLATFVLYIIRANCAVVKPRDLEDEVKVQLDELRTIVRSAIFQAIRNLENVVADTYHYRDDALEDAKLSITQAYQNLNDSMTQLKDAASFTNKDPDQCLKFREELFHRMPLETIDSLSECIATFNKEVTIIDNDVRYRIDSQMSQADVFDFQILQCKGEQKQSCLSIVTEKINESLFKIPQTIDVEAENAQQVLARLKLTSVECANSKASHYATEGTSLFEAISTCVESWPSQ